MSAIFPQAPWIARLPALLVPLSLALWGVYMVLLTGYCVVYQNLVSAEMADVRGMAFWILREWWLWALVTPLIFMGFRRCSVRLGLMTTYLRVGGLALLAMLLVKIFLDRLTLQLGPALVVVIYSVRYLATLVVITYFWHFFLRPRSLAVASSPGIAPLPATVPALEPSPTPGIEVPVQPKVTAPPQTLLVNKGNDKCPLRIDRIDFVNAAGNYVEIHSGGQVYLLRATMKEVEALLPRGQFLRVHRCHIVNLDEIDRIKTRAAGNGTVHLRSGRVLSISRAAHARLKSND